jgi:assimilatory nitrate reductase catalytic subunit
MLKQVKQAPGEALADFSIFKLVAEAWGCGEMFEPWTSPEAAFELLQQISAGQPCDITGINGYAHIDGAGGVQWPFPAGSACASASTVVTDNGNDVGAAGRGGGREDPDPNQRRLFADGRFCTPDERAAATRPCLPPISPFVAQQ